MKSVTLKYQQNSVSSAKINRSMNKAEKNLFLSCLDDKQSKVSTRGSICQSLNLTITLCMSCMIPPFSHQLVCMPLLHRLLLLLQPTFQLQRHCFTH